MVDGDATISNFAATASTWTDPSSGSRDIFVVWQSSSLSSTTWAVKATYFSNAGFSESSSPGTVEAGGVFEPTLVAGTNSLAGNYVWIMGLRGLKQEQNTGTLPATSCPTAERAIPQTWVTDFSVDDGADWLRGSQLNASVWRCAGGAHDVVSSVYPVSQRPGSGG